MTVLKRALAKYQSHFDATSDVYMAASTAMLELDEIETDVGTPRADLVPERLVGFYERHVVTIADAGGSLPDERSQATRILARTLAYIHLLQAWTIASEPARRVTDRASSDA